MTVLDVRPEDEFAFGHVPGALNIPVAALDGHLALQPLTSEIVAYGRGPYGVLSFEAVAALRARGYRVRRLEKGVSRVEGGAAFGRSGAESCECHPVMHGGMGAALTDAAHDFPFVTACWYTWSQTPANLPLPMPTQPAFIPSPALPCRSVR